MRIGKVDNRFVVVEQTLCSYGQVICFFTLLIVTDHYTEVMYIVERFFIIGIYVECLISRVVSGFC